jgi:uncharacterized protein (DUF4415 family)
MTTGIEELKLPVRKKGRGPGKKPALVAINVRVPKEVLEFYKTFGKAQQSKMREVLGAYARIFIQGEANVD